MDYVLAGQLWAFPYCFMVGLYLISRNIGMILEAIKNW